MRSSRCPRDRSATWTRCAATRAASGVHFQPSFARSRCLRRTHPWKGRSSFVWPPRENEHAARRLRALPNSYPIATDHTGVKPLHSALADRPPTSPIRTQPTPLHRPQTQASSSARQPPGQAMGERRRRCSTWSSARSSTRATTDAAAPPSFLLPCSSTADASAVTTAAR